MAPSQIERDRIIVIPDDDDQPGAASQSQCKLSRASTATIEGDERGPSGSGLAGGGPSSSLTPCHPTCVRSIETDDEADIICRDDFLTDEEFKHLIHASQTTERESPSHSPRRNERPQYPWVEVSGCHFEGTTIRPRKTVELRPKKTAELVDEDFLRITTIIKHVISGEVKLRGSRLRRTKAVQGMLGKKRNEVCMMLQVDEDDPRDALVQGLEEISLEEVKRIRILYITNEEFPARSFRVTEKTGEKTADDVVFNTCQLVCRVKFIQSFPTARDRERLRSSGDEFLRIREGDEGNYEPVPDEELRFGWRGHTVKGGTGRLKKSEEDVIDLTGPSSSALNRKRSRLETFEGFGSIDLDEIPATPIDLTEESELPTPCPTPKRNFNLKNKTPKIITTTQTLSIDITMDGNPKLSIDLTTADEVEEVNGTGLTSGHRVKASIVRESDGPRSTTQCNGSLSSWKPAETPTKRQRREVVQVPTPPNSSRSAQVEVTGSRDARSAPWNRPSDCRPIPFRLPRPKRDGPNGTLVQDVVEISAARRRVDLTDEYIQTYSGGDCFCGAGGVSCGARLAGLDIDWAFDNDPAAMFSYILNHAGTHAYQKDADQFVSIEGKDWKKDWIHLSPPCQYFSPAHTVDGQDDEKNVAVQFALPELIKKSRPRIVTYEQTYGLLQSHRHFFNRIVQCFTELGFSVRWKVFNLAEYGLPQARKRLILFASCPGEVLPPFPKPTHSGDPNTCPRYGLAPLTTINDAIGNIPRSAANHDPETAQRLSLPPYSGDIPLPRCITTSGGQNVHPSGTRKFTLREFACLQGFPMDYKFGDTRVLKQIGNAVPPSVGKIFFAEVKKALMRADGLL
ncbi:MAG: hypothetical protein M1816_003647 [Peltula sp. TS41687]|nr:MAG: hypothetical protein M1816_003647 [Peltula sp. TS41687]